MDAKRKSEAIEAVCSCKKDKEGAVFATIDFNRIEDPATAVLAGDNGTHLFLICTLIEGVMGESDRSKLYVMFKIVQTIIRMRRNGGIEGHFVDDYVGRF